MNKIQKLDRYLLENRPLLWSSRFVNFMIYALGLWLIAYLYGFSSFAEPLVKARSINAHYFKSFFFSFHMILILVFVILWLVRFMKYNPYKSLYPLEKGYFVKLYGLMLLPLTFLITAYYPFTAGVKHRAAQYLDKKGLMELRDAANLAMPFLPMDKDNYLISERVYPKPFPANIVSYNTATNRWSRSDLYQIVEVDSLGLLVEYEPFELSINKSINVEGKSYLFFKTQHIRLQDNPERSIEVILEDLTPKIEGLQLYKNHLLNYSNLSIPYRTGAYAGQYPEVPAAEVKEKLVRFSFDYYNDPFSVKADSVFAHRYAPTVHKWVKNQSYEKIKEQIKKFRSLLEVYGIPNHLNENQILQYLKVKKLKNLDGVVHSYEYDMDLEEAIDNSNISKKEYEAMPFQLKMEYFSESFIDLASLLRVFENLKIVEQNHLFSGFSFVLLIVALAAALLFFILYTCRIKSFLLSLPIWGILQLVLGLMLANVNGVRAEVALIGSYIVLLIIVIVINWWFLNDPKISKRPLHVTMPMTLFATPLLCALVPILIHFSSRHLATNPIGIETTVYWLDGWLIHPFVLYLFAAGGLLLGLQLLRLYRAKADSY